MMPAADDNQARFGVGFLALAQKLPSPQDRQNPLAAAGRADDWRRFTWHKWFSNKNCWLPSVLTIFPWSNQRPSTIQRTDRGSDRRKGDEIRNGHEHVIAKRSIQRENPDDDDDGYWNDPKQDREEASGQAALRSVGTASAVSGLPRKWLRRRISFEKTSNSHGSAAETGQSTAQSIFTRERTGQLTYAHCL